MPSYETIIFLAGLLFIAILIWLLTLTSSAIYRDNSNNTAKSTHQSDNPKDNIPHGTQIGLAAISDAIQSHGHARHSEDRDRSKREKVTIIVLGATAGFALFAAGAGIWSAWIFQGQLTEMREERRAWVKWNSIKPQGVLERVGNSIRGTVSYQLHNSGKTPAVLVGFWPKLVLQLWEIARPDYSADPTKYQPSFQRPPDITKMATDNCDAGARTAIQLEQTSAISHHAWAWGQTVFPDETTEPGNQSVNRANDEITARGLRDNAV